MSNYSGNFRNCECKDCYWVIKEVYFFDMHMSEVASLIQAYAAQPIGQWVLEQFDIVYELENSLCGDDIVVYALLSSDKLTIEKFSHAWSPQMFTLASASILAEQVQWELVSTVLQWWVSTMENRWLYVSPRRKRATVTALLALHNGLVEYLSQWEKRDYETILQQ